MKENMLDVLFYLFENYSENNPSQDRDSLQDYLVNAGFKSKEVNKAFDWLEKLADSSNTVALSRTNHPLRLYTTEEQKWIDPTCQGHLFFLEQAGVLDATMREQVIDQVVALEDRNFSLDKLKWIILMIMLNRKENKEHAEETEAKMDFLWLDSVTYDHEHEHYH